jgi:hypothetical protein
MAHSGSEPLPATNNERNAWGQRGADQIRAIVKKMSLPQAMAALREHDRYTQQVIVPRLQQHLPQK